MSAIDDIASEESKMEMTPMIDVTFLLLIFFICTIKFKTLEGKLAAYLPKDEGTTEEKQDPIEKIDIVVQLKQAGHKIEAKAFERDGSQVEWLSTKQGDFLLRDHHVTYRLVRQTFQDDSHGQALMRQALIDLRRVDDQRPVTLKPMQGIVYADVIPALDMLIDLDFTDVTFAGSPGR